MLVCELNTLCESTFCQQNIFLITSLFNQHVQYVINTKNIHTHKECFMNQNLAPSGLNNGPSNAPPPPPVMLPSIMTENKKFETICSTL